MTREVCFDNEKYLKEQTAEILKRVKMFNDKLYLEFGGKLLYDFHAARVLPGYDPNCKMRLLAELKDKADIVLCIYAGDIERKKIRADFGITYDSDALKLIDDLRSWDINVLGVNITLALDAGLEVGKDHARLSHGDHVVPRYGDDPVHPRHLEEDPPLQGGSPAGEPGAGPARVDGDPALVGEEEDARHLLGAAGPDHDIGERPLFHGVDAVADAVFFSRREMPPADDGRQCRNDFFRRVHSMAPRARCAERAPYTIIARGGLQRASKRPKRAEGAGRPPERGISALPESACDCLAVATPRISMA